MRHITITKKEFEGAEINSVNSRDLHKNLGIKTEYKKWADRLIEKYQFTENEDYLTIVKNDGRNNSTDYIFTLDTAKEVCMVSNTDKGRETRKYFIKVEKQFNQDSNLQLDIQFKRLEALTSVAKATKNVLDTHDQRLNNLEQNRRMESWQEKNLLDAKNRKVYEMAGDDKKLASKLHRNVWSHFKKRFHLPRYNELTTGRYEDGLMWLNNISLADVV